MSPHHRPLLPARQRDGPQHAEIKDRDVADGEKSPMRNSLLRLLLLMLAFPSGGIASARGASAPAYRRMADQALARHQYELAARYYREEAAIYRGRGDMNGARVEEMKAERWSTELDLYAAVHPDRKALLGLYTGAKFEPVYGCYLGAYVANDDRLGGSAFTGNQMYAGRAAALGDMVNKHLATSWDYCEYGSRFPLRWAQELCRLGIAPHIAMEPNRGLDLVQDDDYLQSFAIAAASCGGPVFLRFAGEMNGDWTAYHGDPELYRRKFRTVHDVMARLAPNVAMIWCVNSVPEYNMDGYYPGDDAVDWVGVNFYSVLHHDNDPSRPAWFENPATLLKYVYHRYAGRKPIAICEYGASHREKINPYVDQSAIAAGKIAALLAALPRQFPRVKLVGFFDCDNLSARNIVSGRQLNDYSVTDSPEVLAALTRAVASDYYLPAVLTEKQQALPTWTRALAPGAVLTGTVSLSAWIKTYDLDPAAVYAIDGQTFARLAAPGEYRVDLDTSRYAPGRHNLSIQVFDSAGQQAGRKDVAISIARPRDSPEAAAR